MAGAGASSPDGKAATFIGGKETLHLAAGRLTLHLPAAHSLKERRQAARSLTARLRNKFNVAVAEAGADDRWQVLTLLLVAASNDAAHAREQVDEAADFVAEIRPDLELMEWTVEVISGV